MRLRFIANEMKALFSQFGYFFSPYGWGCLHGRCRQVGKDSIFQFNKSIHFVSQGKRDYDWCAQTLLLQWQKKCFLPDILCSSITLT